MNNINFANPWLLLIAIPLLALVIIAYIMAVKKENKTFNNTFSFITHIIIVVLLVLTMAKTTFEKVMTETNIYVLADVSYSSNNNLDLIDEYISDLKNNVPKNSKIGIVCFGKDYELLVDIDEDIISVKNATVDESATDICGALEYTATLFKDNVIKRIVIISDGKETNNSDIVNVVTSLTNDNIYIDAIYLDNNIKDDVKEVQINQVDYNSSTFLNVNESVDVILQSSCDTKAILTLYCDDAEYDQKAIYVYQGYNAYTFALNTEESGEHIYNLVVSTNDDTSNYNNEYMFNQKVSEKAKVMFISQSEEDKIAADELYGENVEIDYYINSQEIPYTIEDLCEYDEFILSNIDIRTINNYSQFINALDTLVSEFGKSLITMGNTYIQNNYDDETLAALSDMLPTKYGSNEQDDKLVTIVLDISRSMSMANSAIRIAKAAAKAIINNLDDKVDVVLVPFFGETSIDTPISAKEKDKLNSIIDGYGTYQGTLLGSALKHTYSFINELPYDKKEVVLITDGEQYGSEDEQDSMALLYAEKMMKSNIRMSVIHTYPKKDQSRCDFCKKMAEVNNGKYYLLEDEDDAESLVLNQVLNALTDVELDYQPSSVEILKTKDPLVSGIDNLPNINGLYNNSKKSSAVVVLEATYVDKNNDSYKIPLYSYWNYGNGKVSSFASSISGKWAENWTANESSRKVLKNISLTNIPDSRVDSAFIINTNTEGLETQVIVKAPSLNSDSVLKIDITYPDKTVKSEVLTLQVENYIASIITDQIGEYTIVLSYQLGELNYQAEYKFYISYLPEYNSFTLFEASNLYYMVSMNGQISEDGKLVLENNNSKIQKYILDFTPIFMIICVILFIIDIMVRKLRWQDIKSLFKFLNKKEYTNTQERRNSNEK